MSKNKYKVSIIGSGFGALSLAIRLQAKGFDVTIFEKNEKVGGHAYQFEEKGYTFDMGPSLITAPFIIEKIFQVAGRKMEDYLKLIPLDPYYRIYFHDKSYLDYSGDSKKMIQEISKFNKEDAQNYPKFMNYASRLYKLVIEDELGAVPFDNKLLIKFLPEALRTSAFLPAFSVVKRYFKNPNIQFTFSFHPLFIGGNPFNAPALYLMIPYLEKIGGVYFTKGGMYSVVQALEKVFLELGGSIRTNSEVKKVLIEDRKAIGIQTNNGEFKSDLVVSNAHFAHTYKDLIAEKDRKKWTNKKIDKINYSMSCFLIYLGVKKKYPQLFHHTLILSKRYKELIKDIFKKKTLPEDFSMYLHVPSKTDENMAPKGSESIYLLIPVANLKGNIDWEAIKERFAEKVVKFLEEEFGLNDLQKNIEVMKIFTPLDFQNERNNYFGSAWGAEPSLLQVANFKARNRSEDIKNLYLVGANTHPGPGVPGVMLSAEATEKVILEDFRMN